MYFTFCTEPSLGFAFVLQPKGHMPDYGAPVVLHASGPSVELFCDRIHKQLLAQFKYAWVWGSSVRHQPQKVSSVAVAVTVTASHCCF